MNKLDLLRSELEKARKKLNDKGIHYSGDADNYEEIMKAKPFEIAYQDVIEKIWPDSAWWQVTGYWDIFDAMMGGLSDAEVIDEIIKHVGKDFIRESKENIVNGAKIEYGHSLNDYFDKFGDAYDNGALWDFSKEDFENGAIEPRNIVYWYMQDIDGDWRYFETDIANESLKEDKLDEGTSNFGRLKYFPLLVFYTVDEFYDMMRDDPDYPQEQDFEKEDENGHYYIDDEAYEDARDDFEQKFWDENEVCVMDEDDLERLENMLYDFNKESENMAYDADVNEDGYQEYGPNLNLEDVKLKVEPGYYSAAYIDVEHEDYLDDLEDDFKKQQMLRFNAFFDQLKKEFGLTKLGIAWGPASNGETGYKILNDSLKENKEEVREDAHQEELGLPKDVDIQIDDELREFISNSDKDGFEEYISNYLSDKYGFCHFGWNYDIDANEDCVHVTDIDWDTSDEGMERCELENLEEKKEKKDYYYQFDICYWDEGYEEVEEFETEEYFPSAKALQKAIRDEYGKDYYAKIKYTTDPAFKDSKKVVYSPDEPEDESLEEKKSKKKYKINFTGDPAKNAAFFNHAMGSDKGDGGLQQGGTTLGEDIKRHYYEYELGVILEPGQGEYDSYKMDGVYGGELSFYDESQGAFPEDELDKLKEDCKKYVEEGVNGTYAIIKGPFDLDDDIEIDDIKEFCYDLDCVLWSYRKDKDGNIVEAFLNVKEESLKEDKQNDFNINIEVLVEPKLGEDVVSGNPEDKYDDQTLEDWYDFASNVEGLIDKIGTVVNVSESKQSLSQYIDFYAKDKDGNKLNGLVDLRLSDHKSTSNARKLRKKKAQKLDPHFRLVSVIVNKKQFDSYEDALIYIEKLLNNIVAEKTKENSSLEESNKRFALVVNGEWYSTFDSYEKADEARQRMQDACSNDDDARGYYGECPNIDIKEIDESLEESHEVEKDFSKKDINAMIDWWKKLYDLGKYNIDIGDGKFEDVEGWHAAMFDMLDDLSKEDTEEAKELFNSGKKLYNKYALSKYNEEYNSEYIWKSNVNDKDIWYLCKRGEAFALDNALGQALAVIEPTPSDGGVYYGYSAYINDKERESNIYNLAQLKKFIKDNYDKYINDEKFGMYKKPLDSDSKTEELKEGTTTLEDGTEIKMFDTYDEAYKYLEMLAKNFEHYEIVEDSYEIDNGLLLIAYEKTDDDEVEPGSDDYWVETGENILVGYKKNANESLEESLDFEEMAEILNGLENFLREEDVYYEVWFDTKNDTVNAEIEWGDWKHDHLWFDHLAEQYLNSKGYEVIDVNVDVTDEDGSDTYSAIHSLKIRKKPKVEEGANYSKYAYYEYPKGSGCHVRETPTCFVAISKHGASVGESQTKAGAEGILDDYLNNLNKVRGGLDDGKAYYWVKFWEDEERRDMGESDIYMDDFETKEEAIRLARNLIDRMGYASVEVFYSPEGDINENDDELVWGYDGVDVWGQDKEESLNEELVYGLFAKVRGPQDKSFKDYDMGKPIKTGSKEEMNSEKKSFEDSWNVNPQGNIFKFSVKEIGNNDH